MEGARFSLQKDVLGIELRLRIKRNGLCDGPLVHQVFGSSIDTATRSEHKALDTIALRDLQHHERSGIVDLQRVFIFGRASWIAHNGRQMNDGANVVHGTYNVLDVATIALYELQMGMAQNRFDRLIPIHQVIEKTHPAVARKQLRHENSSDVSCSTHNQDGVVRIGDDLYVRTLKCLGFPVEQVFLQPTDTGGGADGQQAKDQSGGTRQKWVRG